MCLYWLIHFCVNIRARARVHVHLFALIHYYYLLNKQLLLFLKIWYLVSHRLNAHLRHLNYGCFLHIAQMHRQNNLIWRWKRFHSINFQPLNLFCRTLFTRLILLANGPVQGNQQIVESQKIIIVIDHSLLTVSVIKLSWNSSSIKKNR